MQRDRPWFLTLAVPGALAAALHAGPALAQSRDRPLLVISMTAGFQTGGRMWRLDRQLAAVASGDVDSLALGRNFRTGLFAGVGATLFRSPHLGITAEVAFLGLGTESRCTPLGPYAFDSQHVNEQACVSIQGNRLATNATAIQAGVVWRARPGGKVHPFLRAIAGGAVLGRSFIDSRAVVAVPDVEERVLLTEQGRRELTWMSTLSAGVMLDVSPGHQLRFEARDVLIGLPVPTGPASITGGLPFAPTADRVFHLPSFAVTLDLVLEPVRHPRRY